MKQKLQPKSKDKIEKNYKEHPLLSAIRTCCMGYISRNKLCLSVEEVFVEVLRLIDDLKADPDSAESICSNRWHQLMMENRNAYADADEQSFDCSVFLPLYVGASLLQWYDGSYEVFYHHKAQLLADSIFDNWTEAKSDIAAIQPRFVDCYDSLLVWINDYMTSNEFLSDVILNADEKTRRGRGKAPDTPHTLKYINPISVNRTLRINVFSATLENLGYIESETKPEKFYKFFSGEDGHCDIKWTGAVKILSALLNELMPLPFIKKGSQAGCTVKSLVEKQFGLKPDAHPVDDATMEAIHILVWILDPKSALPMVKQGKYEAPDTSISGLKQAWEADLTIKQHR